MKRPKKLRWLKETRKMLDKTELSAAYISGKTGISERTINDIKSANRSPRVDTVEKIYRFLEAQK